MVNRGCVCSPEMSIDSDRDSVAESEEGKDRDVSLECFHLSFHISVRELV